MDEKAIKNLIEEKITHYRASYRITDKDRFSAGALEALMSLAEEIDERNEEQ
ncbi:hypothetical protein [Salibacterium qingdaonense]|uniref:Uncharacterized protein n=1 Tax=Salibacterium qingdaonense TaxID=266892 RepID=A0A1I4Q5P3_9BACI|nr:hypothetical protein [Salibacterium qingdaonense]SFM35367.1 hypothetical protein SAMN04488054_13714 [Salibacterium qingdaonense]